jgi:hypothetical protein
MQDAIWIWHQQLPNFKASNDGPQQGEAVASLPEAL